MEIYYLINLSGLWFLINQSFSILPFTISSINSASPGERNSAVLFLTVDMC